MPPAVRLTLAAPLSVLRRPDDRLQVGLDVERSLILPGAPPGAEAALRALRTPRTLLEVRRLVPLVEAEWLRGAVATLTDAGLVRAAPTQPADVPVAVLGSGSLAAALAEMLSAEGHTVLGRSSAAGTDAARIVVLCGQTVEPDRVLARDLTASGRAHLVVRAEPERVVVGPFVEPGELPCIACTDLVRRDLDPEWPLLLAQLCRSEHRPSPRQVAWAAATAAAQVAAGLDGRRPEASGATLELDAHEGTLGVRRWRRHPDCGCTLAAA